MKITSVTIRKKFKMFSFHFDNGFIVSTRFGHEMISVDLIDTICAVKRDWIFRNLPSEEISYIESCESISDKLFCDDADIIEMMYSADEKMSEAIIKLIS